jgi:oxygen-dependent protoporphyrinogen oxidase
LASIVVVGSGLAGLTCAWRLQEAGHDVEVLEREPESGGRTRTEVHGDYRLDSNPNLFSDADRELHRLLGELDLSDRVHALPWQEAAILRDGVFHTLDLHDLPGLLRSAPVSRMARARWPKLAFELFRKRRQLDRLRPERAADMDRETLAAGARRVVGDQNLEWLLGPAFSAAFHGDPEELSWAFALLTLAHRVRAREIQCLRGGAGWLTRALADRVDVRHGCQVVSIETQTDGARVRYRSGGHPGGAVADAVVVAVPGSEVAALCPKLTPSERGFLEHVRYARSIGVHVILDETPGDLPGFALAFPRASGLDLSGMTLDHYRVGLSPLGSGLLNVALTPRAAARLWQAPDAEVSARVLEQLAQTPVGRLDPRECVVHRMASRLPLFEAGYLPRLARFGSRMDASPRLAFAGDYRVAPSLEGAVVSGMRASLEIAAAL